MLDVPPLSRALDDAIRRAVDSKTKPLGALGAVETLAARIARIQGTLTPSLHRCRLTLFAADHGIAREGVSAYPQAVTRQMVANFLAGGAAANVFARTNGVDLSVVDAGVAGEPIDAPGLVSRRIGAGTRNFAVEPAMTEEQCEAALRAGDALGANVAADAAAFGEMGSRTRRRPAWSRTAHRHRARCTDRPRHGTRRRRAGAQARGPRARRIPQRAASRRPRGVARVRRLRGRDDGRRDDRRGPGQGGGAGGRVHPPAPPRWRRSSLPRRCGITWCRAPFRRARATARCSTPSARGRCSTSTCASAKAPAPCSHGRCSSARRR